MGSLNLGFIMDVRWKWILKLLLIFALWNNVYAQGPLIVYQGNAHFFCPKDSSDWYMSGGFCHIVVYNATTQREASRICMARNGILLSVNDSMETWDMSWHLNNLVGSFSDSLFWTAYEVSQCTNQPHVSLSQGRIRNLPIYNNLWAMGEPNLGPDHTCVALDASVTDPNKYGWHTVDCQMSLPFICSYVACQKHEFRCHDNSRCINDTYLCDGAEDCPDASDEIGCSVDCGQTFLQNLTGSVTSPNWPKYYPDDATCVWQILLPKQYKILLKVSKFETERFHDVLYAKEGFWDGQVDWDSIPDSSLLFNKSGSLTNDQFPYRTATNSLLLKFVSDESITRQGFLISWEADDSIRDCVPEKPITATNLERELVSPGYHNGQYPSNVMCEWVIQSEDPNTTVSLQFIDFTLAKTDWVQIFDQVSTSNQSINDLLIDTYSSDHPPYVITSRYGSIKVQFYSDSKQAAKGFALVYKSGCAGLTINSTFAYFDSADSTGHLPGLTCQYKLYHPTGKKITVQLKNVALYGSDSIKITSVTAETIYTNNSSDMAPVSSKNGIITITFVSNSAYSGFEGSYSEDCPPLPSISHGNISTAYTFYGVVVEFKCDIGYKLVGNQNVTCGPNGNWSGQVPRCEVVHCGAPPRMPYGLVQTIVCSKQDMCNVTYACDPGCVRKSAQMSCTMDGRWTPTTPACALVACSKPPASPPHAVQVDPTNSTYFLNDIVRYRCESPYKTFGPAFAVCTVSGTWLMANFTCKLPVCHAAMVLFGLHLGDEFIYNQQMTQLQCLPGFKQNSTLFRCGSESWEPMLACEGLCKMCTDNISTSDIVVWDVDECVASGGTVCRNGTCRNLKGSWVCECSRGWYWNETTRQCEDVDECQFNNDCDVDHLCENTPGSYVCRCPAGYILYNGESALTNSTKLRIGGSCIPVQCPEPVYNVSLIKMTTNDSLYTYKAAVTFECRKPFVPAGNWTVVSAVCLANGQWTAQIPDCIEASCPQPKPIADGHYVPIFAQNAVIAPGSIVEYFCSSSHVLRGPKRRVCMESTLRWSGPDPTCDARNCPELDPPDGGFVTYTKNRTAGTAAHFYCDPFHKLVGSESLKCGEDGCWQGLPPKYHSLTCDLSKLTDLVIPQDSDITDVAIGNVVKFRCSISGFSITDRASLLCRASTDLPVFPGPEKTAIIGARSAHRIKRSDTWSFMDVVLGRQPRLKAESCKKLEINKITSDTYIEEGEIVDLTCAVEADCSEFQITWERGVAFGRVSGSNSINDQDQTQGRMTFIQTGAQSYTLQIQKSQRQDTGYYWCKVWSHNVVRVQTPVLLVVTRGADRTRRQAVPANELPPEFVYLYDSSNSSNGTEWTSVAGSNGTDRFAFASISGSRLCHTLQPYNSWLRSPFVAAPANEHSVTAEAELVPLRSFCGNCLQLGILEGDHVEPDNSSSYRLLEYEDAEAILPTANVECTANGKWATDPFGGSCVCKAGYIRRNGACVKKGPLCYVCQDADSVAQCNRRSQLQQCRGDEVCTTILSTTPSFKLTKGCVKADKCQNRIGTHSTMCLHGDASCQVCCANDYCNIIPYTAPIPEWNSTFPTCLDVEPPKFLHCSGKNVTVPLDFDGNPVIDQESQDGVPFRFPVAADNGGSVTVTVQPADLWSKTVYDHGPTRVTVTARDSANLTATCSFFVIGKKFVSGRLNCSEKVVEDTVSYLENSQKVARTRYPAFNFTDGRAVVKRLYEPAQGALVEIGRPLRVQMAAYDATGLEENCSFSYVIRALGCPDWTLPGFETLTTAPQCLTANRAGSAPTVCSFGIQNCTDGLWVPAEGPFTFMCNGSGIWRVSQNENRGIDSLAYFLPTCAAYYVPSISFALQVNVTIAGGSSSSEEDRNSSKRKPPSECVGHQVTRVQEEGIAILKESCTEIMNGLLEKEELESLVMWNVTSSAIDEIVSIRLNFTLSSPKSTPQSNVLLQCVQEFQAELKQGHRFKSRKERGCPKTTVKTAVIDHIAEPCPRGHVKRLNKNASGNFGSELDYLCVKCPPGTFADSIKPECTPCAPGAYQPASGQDVCLPCPANTSTLHPYGRSAKDCFDFCPPGHFSDTGLEPCHACPVEFYQPHTRNFNCIRCPNGTSTAMHGAVSVEECRVSCKPGSYGENGLVPCFQCPVGYAQPNGHSTTCVKCSEGNTTAGIGAADLAGCEKPGPCTVDSCANGGVCTTSWPENQCNCPPGTFGRRCRLTLRTCSNSTCANGGTCIVAGREGFQCSCTNGFSGKYCERLQPRNKTHEIATGSIDFEYLCSKPQCGQCHCDYQTAVLKDSSGLCQWNTSYDPCNCNPCALCILENTVSCRLNITAPHSSKCICKSGWTGQYCERAAGNDQCDISGVTNRTSHCTLEKDPEHCPLKCRNGGSCRRMEHHYECECKDGYFGTFCQKSVDPCLEQPCENGGLCRPNASDAAKFSCQCQYGWTGDWCQTEIDVCSTGPCANGGTCHGRFGGFQCFCDPAWTGPTCETRIDQCQIFQCYSGGTCKLNASGHPYCLCLKPWTGPHCEKYACSDSKACPANERCVQSTNAGQCEPRPSVTCQSKFCDNGGSCQQNDSHGYTCDCPPGYIGDTCAEEVDACEHNMCQNNATCKRSARGGYLCFCQLGFIGQYCESTISGCDDNPCQNGGTCTDVGNGVYCICTSLYTGQYCDKARSQNFNMLFNGRDGVKNMSWIVTSEFTLTDKLSSITLCFWVRFNDDGGAAPKQMTYLTVAKVRRNKERPTELNLLPFIQFTESGLILNSPGKINRKVAVDLPVNDTAWHLVCFDWRSASSDWILYVDGQKFKTNEGYSREFFDASTITQGPYTIVLGQSIEKQKFFNGDLSMVTLVSAIEVTNSDISNYYNNCGGILLNGEDLSSRVSSIVRWIDFTHPDQGDLSVMVTYPSVCSPYYCLPEQKNCKFDKIPPEVKYCPKDRSIWSATRMIAATWPQPHFVDNVEVARVSSNFRSGQLLPWGEYQVVYTATDRAGNAAVCKFRVYITPFKCNTLTGPTNTTQANCHRFSQGLVCTLNCSEDQRLTQLVRPFYVCGIEGTYDPLSPDLPLMLPACAPLANVTSEENLWTTVEAKLGMDDTADCQNEYNMTVIKQTILQKLESMNRLKFSLCNSRQCNFSGAIRLKCVKNVGLDQGRIKRALVFDDGKNRTAEYVDFTFKWRTTNRTVLTEFVAQALRSASPSIFSVAELASRISCPPGSAYMDGICVLCSIGTYYDAPTESCSPCPLNTYNSYAGRSNCTPCDTGQITVTVGGQFLRDCIDNCTPGYYFNYSTRACAPCDIGLYQSNYGSTSCSSCDPGQTTIHSSSTSMDNCEYLCGPGAELDSAGLGCVPCPLGTYKTAQNDSGCTMCVMDYTTPTAGSTSGSNCTVLYCSPGKYRSGDQCKVCPVGTYQDESNQKSCKNCPNGEITQYPQSTSISDCKSGGCTNLCDLCPPQNATCKFEACQTICTCKPGYEKMANTSNVCIDKCELTCTKDQMCLYSNESEPYCRAQIDTDEKVKSLIIGAASGGFVAIILIIALVVILKIRLYHLIRCCKKPSVKHMSSNQYYRNTTYPAIGEVQARGRTRNFHADARTTTSRTQSGAEVCYDVGVECFDMKDLKPTHISDGSEPNQNAKNEIDMMTPNDVYSAIYEGLQGARDRALSDYLTSASQSTAIFENRAFDFEDEPPSPPPYSDDMPTPDEFAFGRARFRSSDATSDDGGLFVCSLSFALQPHTRLST